MPPVEGADDDVGERLGIVPRVDLAARHAFLDEFEERVVQGETTLDAVPRSRQHLRDDLAVGVTRTAQGRSDVVKDTDQPGRDRLIGAIEHDVMEVEEASLGERPHHVVPGGEVVEERSICNVGALADVLDGRCGHTLNQEQVERRTQNPVAHFLLAAVHPVHGCEPSAALSDSRQFAR